MEDGAPSGRRCSGTTTTASTTPARNIWRGLAGMWIVEDELDPSLPLPSGDRDIPLMIADRSFDRHNQLTDPFTGLRPPADGVAGHRVLVNGAYMPRHASRPRATGCGYSTSPASAPTTSTSPTARRWSRSLPTAG